MFHEECLHGQAAVDATSFSQPIGLGATFDPDLVERLFTMTAAEARSRGTHQALTPVVDVARDPRWGRVEETYGEDPYLVARLGIAAVQGFQGDGTFRDKQHVIATLKHFAAHGQPESGNNCAPVNISERVLRETFLYTFQEAIDEGGAMSVMASYNEIDGVPSHANRWLLRDVLRKEWGFKGYVVSDYYAIRELAERPELYGHHVAQDGKEACLLAVRAGVNIELPEPDCYKHLVELVEEGTLKESELDELVAPMLDVQIPAGAVRGSVRRSGGGGADRRLRRASRARARGGPQDDHAAQERRTTSLPLDVEEAQDARRDRPERRPRAAWAATAAGRSIARRCSKASATASASDVEVLYHEGCKITIGGSWQQDEVTPSDPARIAARSPRRRSWPQRADVDRALHRRQRADLARSLDGQPPGRPRESRHGRPAGRTGRRDRRDRQADHRGRVQRPAAVDSQSSRRRRRRSSSAGISARRRARRWPRRSSAT